MRVLLLGSGGREHALAAALAADPAVSTLTCAPGNPGIATVRLAATGAPVELAELDILDVIAVAALARDTADLVVVGPEAPLMAGIADVVRRAGVACFGPSRAAALLEGSKAFAKDVMHDAGVPSSRWYAIADPADNPAQVAAALDEFGPPYVVKDDGLAAGKGVVVTSDRVAALDHALGCDRIVVEEHLSGPEVSLFVVTDGVAALPLLPAQDFKRIGDGDTGPNTGGMGAYAPLPWLPPSLVDDVMSAVVHPTLEAMAGKGTPFVGLLYVGLMITSAGPRVIEFNCRFGDPETQAVLALLETPMAGLLHAAAVGELAGHPPLRWRAGSAVTVVIAATGYPQGPRRGDAIKGADGVAGILHSGTARGADGTLVSAGGRVLACTATGPDLSAAREAAYALVDGVSLADSQHRRDIALAAARDEIAVPVA